MLDKFFFFYIFNKKKYIFPGSLGISPTRNYIQFLKIAFVVARVGCIPIISTKRINQIKKEKL